MDAVLNIFSYMFQQLLSPAMKSSSAWAAFLFLTILGSYFSLRIFFGSIALVKENAISKLSFLSIVFPILTVFLGFLSFLLFLDVFLELTGFFKNFKEFFLGPLFEQILPGLLYQNEYRLKSEAVLNLLFSYCSLFISLGFLFITRIERNFRINRHLNKLKEA